METLRVPGDAVFRRGLDPRFEEALLGPLNLLLRLTREENLDLQIRENYVNVYEGRGSVLKLAFDHGGRLRAFVHRKYEPPAELLRPFDLSASSNWIEQFSEALPSIRASARRHDKREGAAEFHVARVNRVPPLVIVDRQVQLPGQRPSRVDLVGIQCGVDSRPTVVLIELKEGISLPVSSVVEQVKRYDQFYVRHGKLRDDVAASLRHVFEQKIRLGLLNPIPAIQGLDTLPVELLVVLSSRHAPVSARQGWRKRDRLLVHYVGLGAGEHAIPHRSRWETLRGGDIG